MKTHVVKTTRTATLSEAADLLDLYQTTGLPVLDAEERLCGMITEADICRRTGAGREAGAILVEACMTSPAIQISEHADVREAAQLMRTHRLKRLPVVTSEGKVVGVLNRIDLLQALFEGELPDVSVCGL